MPVHFVFYRLPVWKIPNAHIGILPTSKSNNNTFAQHVLLFENFTILICII